MVLHVLGPEPQPWVIYTPEPIVPPEVLFAREKLVEVEPPQLGASVMGLQMLHNLNLLGVAPAAEEALELVITSLGHDVRAGTEECSD